MMKIRCNIDEVAAFRTGHNSPKRVIFLDVDPSTLTQEQRNLIADRMKDRAVHEIKIEGKKRKLGERLKVADPTLEGLLAAIQENERQLQQSSEQSTAA